MSQRGNRLSIEGFQRRHPAMAPAPEIRTGNASASLRRAEPDVLNSYIEAKIPIPAFAELGNIAKNWWHE
jgi:hypothetical protein